MKKVLVALLMFTALIYTNVLASNKTYGNSYSVEAVKNYDGDTITVNINGVPAIFGEGISIRVAGIDTPEMHGKCEKEHQLAVEAKEVVYVILRDHPYVSLLNMRRGKYFRIVADVTTYEGDLATILLDKGLAVKYNGGTKVKDWCK